MKLNVDVPQLDSDSLSPASIREFHRSLRVFAAQNESFPLGLLLPPSFHREAEATSGKGLEELESEDVISFLKTLVVPKSLQSLAQKIDNLKCSTPSGNETRASCVRAFISDVCEYTELATEVATLEYAAPGLAAFLPSVEAQEAYIDEDGEPRIKTMKRTATTEELAAKRVAGFDKHAKKLFLRKLKPKSFSTRVELEAEILSIKTLANVMTLAQTMATHDDSQGGPVFTAPAQSNSSTTEDSTQSNSSSSSTSGGRQTQRQPSRPCRHCGGPHWNNRCPTLTTSQTNEPAAPQTANTSAETPQRWASGRVTGTLRQAPPKTEGNEASAVDAAALDEEVVVTEAVINTKKYSVIIDTGAGKSFMSSRVLHELQEEDKSVKTGTCPAVYVRQAGGSILKCTTTVTLSVVMNHITRMPVSLVQEFMVLPGGQRKILIGCGARRSLGLLDHEGLSLHFTNNQAEDNEKDTPFPHEYVDEANMAEDASNKGIEAIQIPTSSISAQIQELCREFKEVFNPELPQEGSNLEPMTIELQDERHVVQQRPRPLNGNKRALVREEVARLREQGFMQNSKGPFSSPVVVVTGGHKGSTKIRLCVDYKALNAETIKDKYPMPDIRDFARRAAGAKYFATLDLRQGYYQLRMDLTDIPKTAFVTPDDYGEFTRCPFGLTNAPARFQRAMNKAFHEVLHKGVEIYLDDIFVFANTEEEFLDRMRKVLRICQDTNLRLKASKCTVGASEVEVVGLVCNRDGVQLSTQRIQDLMEVPRPRNISELQSTLGSFNYVSKFVEDSSRILEPLNRLRRKDAQLVWDKAQEKAFTTFKSRVKEHVSLSYPNLDRKWVLHTDASQTGYGGVLYQQTAPGEGQGWQIVSFFAGTFSKTQQKWSTYEQELWGILACLTRPDMAPLFRLHPDLHVDGPQKSDLLFNKADANNKLLRWSQIMQDYQFTIDHIAGRYNAVADHLSRCSAANCAVTTDDWRRDILEAQAAAPEEEQEEWVKEETREPDGVWSHEGTPIIPEGAAQLQASILAQGHFRHEGRAKTLERASKLGYWIGRASDVANKVAQCPICQKTRLRNFLESQDGSTTSHIDQPWHTVAIDTVGPISEDSQGMKFIFVLTDLYTRYTELVAAPANNAQEAAHAIWLAVTRHGVPQFLKSDNGSEYVNQTVSALLKTIKAHHQRTLPYHPQSNGVVERKNGEVMRHLRWLVLSMDGFATWSTLLPYVQHIVNTTVHSVTGFSPHELLYGKRAEIGSVNLKAKDKSDGPAKTAAEYLQMLRVTQAKMDTLNPAHDTPCTGQTLEGGIWSY